MALLQTIQKTLDKQTSITDANSSYQREVGAYLQRFDEYLRSEQGLRTAASAKWVQPAASNLPPLTHIRMSEAIASLEAKVAALAGRPSLARQASFASGREHDRHPSDGSAGGDMQRSKSLLKRLRGSQPLDDAARGRAEGVAAGVAPGRRKRSLSLPRLASAVGINTSGVRM